MNDFAKAYIECALWSSTDDDGEPLDRDYSADDIAPETLERMTADCRAFEAQNESLLSTWHELTGRMSDYAGHDFWLTRNHHGTGFWDRCNDDGNGEQLGRQLTEISHAYGEYDLYIGDDGLVYGG